jgi:exodeoxyribonuclease VII large subunit
MASRFPLFEPIGRDAGLDEDGLYTVSGLTAQIKAVLEGDFGEVGLTGEVSNLARPRSGHVYFSLKDDSAQIRAVLWKADARRVVFELEDGLAVRAWGGLTVYEPRGEYQVIVRKLEPVGIGPLELAFRQVVQRLAAEGLFDPGRKRPLPRFPRRIVVVSSPTGAAVRDFLKVAGRRWPLAEVLLAPSRVQGEGAAAEIAEAIALANRVPGADFLVVARGGGSLEDLWAFNEEIVARAIFGSALPVVSAVGHEIDTTVADLVADVRAPTPSAAGEMCVPDVAEIAAGLDGLRDRMARALTARVRDARAGLDRLADRALRALATDLDRRRRDLARLAAQLEALSPLGVLARGYSLTQRLEDGAVVRSPADAPAGTRLRTRLAGGEVVSRVEG